MWAAGVWEVGERNKKCKWLRMQLIKELAHPGWCYCVCVSQSLFHQSASINSDNAARQLCSMCYITSSKCMQMRARISINKSVATCFKAARLSVCLSLSALTHRLHGLFHYACAIGAFTRKYTRTKAEKRYEVWNIKWCAAVIQQDFV